MDETIPMPVTTTRFMWISSLIIFGGAGSFNPPAAGRTATAGSYLWVPASIALEKADLEVLGPVDSGAVGFQPAVADTQHQL